MDAIRQKQIDEIMDHFDFAKVAKSMQLLNWRWAGEPELRAAARRLLKTVCESTAVECRVACGGLTAVREYGNLTLGFILTTWTAEAEAA